MSVNVIDVSLFRKMVINGAINLKNNHAEVDQLNVFPVPDGDTGTNMSMTVMSGIRELESCESSSIIENAKVLSRGALMGARGNSGVILSQFFRGLYVGLKENTTNELNLEQFMACLESGCKIAYKAVMEPVEGTILTVVRLAAENTRKKMDKFNSIDELMDDYISEAKTALAGTPELLPVLKEAGVVDSGGAGFVKIIEGWKLALEGQTLVLEEGPKPAPAEEVVQVSYCVELFVKLDNAASFEEKDLVSALSLEGDKVVASTKDGVCKLHIHTTTPGRVLESAQKYGEFDVCKVENMAKSHKHLEDGAMNQKKEEAPRKKFALVSVCFGEGIVSIFKELGVDYVIEGGQTMNPSTESFVEAIKKVNADNVIIIPNNGNVIMAAKQAVGLVEGTNVSVLKAKTIAQGYASLMCYDPEASMDDNLANMTDACGAVTSDEITYSIRDTEIGGVKIKAGDFMGIINDKITVSTPAKADCLKETLSKSITEDSQIVTFFCGKDITADEMSGLEDLVHSINKEVEVEIVEGKQDIYSYIIAVE